MKFSIFKLLLFISLIIGLSCNKIETSNVDIGKTLSQRTEICEPGVYSIENGILRFNSEGDYKRAIGFLSCANRDILENWLYSIPIMTTWKYKKDWDSRVCEDSDNLTNEEFNLLMSQYADKIKFSKDEMGNNQFDLKLTALNEFANIDGLFKIGPSLVKIDGNKFIQIIDGDQTKLNLAMSLTESNFDLGIMIHDIVINESLMTLCATSCPNSMSKTVLDQEKEYRFSSGFSIQDLSNILPQQSGGSCEVGLFKVQYILNFNMKGACQKHRWLLGWVCSSLSRSDQIFKGNIVVNYIVGGQMGSKVLNIDKAYKNLCYTEFNENIFEINTGCINRNQFQSFQVCVQSNNLDADATRRGFHLDFDCN